MYERYYYEVQYIDKYSERYLDICIFISKSLLYLISIPTCKYIHLDTFQYDQINSIITIYSHLLKDINVCVYICKYIYVSIYISTCTNLSIDKFIFSHAIYRYIYIFLYSKIYLYIQRYIHIYKSNILGQRVDT